MQEGHDLVAIAFGPNEVRMGRNVVEQWLLLLAQAEHPSPLFGNPVDGALVRRTVPRVTFLDELAFGVKRFTANAIPSFVRREIQVAGIGHTLP